MNMLCVFSDCSRKTYQKMYALSICRREEHDLVATLPLTEQVTCDAVRETSLVIPEEVSSNKPAVLA